MPEYRYAKGRIAESLQFISEEMTEFAQDYADRSWQDYQEDRKLQKLMDRTVENILTALIEVSGTIMTEEGVGVDSYGEALRRCAGLLGLSLDEQEALAKLAAQRNRLAHRYLDYRWQAIRMFKEREQTVVNLIDRMLEREKAVEE